MIINVQIEFKTLYLKQYFKSDKINVSKHFDYHVKILLYY